MNAAGAAPVRLVSPDGARAEVHPCGAHVTSWTTADGRQQLYLSDGARLDGSAAIRGGIPVIFPQFAGEGPLPKHGFARTTWWQQVRPGGADAGSESASVTMELTDSPATLATWPHPFRARLTVDVARDHLDVSLAVENPGAEPLSFAAALHTYLLLDDAFGASIDGLGGLGYRDAITRHPGVQQERQLPVTGAVNRVYAGTPSRIAVRDAGRIVRVETEGFRDTVVWNPGEGGEAALGDMPAGDARWMLCVEPAVVERLVRLAPGEGWRGRQRLVAG